MTSARRPKVLLVEDEPLLRAMSSEQLRDAGFGVVEAAAAAEATALLAQHPEIDVVFTDVHMPGAMDGLGLAREVCRTHPHLPVILTSGLWAGADSDVPEGAVFVSKPYSLAALVQLIVTLAKTS